MDKFERKQEQLIQLLKEAARVNRHSMCGGVCTCEKCEKLARRLGWDLVVHGVTNPKVYDLLKQEVEVV